MPIDLRPYQTDLLGKVSAAMREGSRRNLLVAPTGAGKTRIAAYIADTSVQRGVAPVWFLVHRRELLTQTAKAFADLGINVGLVARGLPMQPAKPVQVVLIGSLRKRSHLLPTPRLLIPDEAHHAVAKSWSDIAEKYPRAWSCGLSASPARLDGRGLGAHFDRLIIGPTLRELIDDGYLVDYKCFAPPSSVDVTGVHKLGGDFNKKELHVALAKSTITGDAVKEYRKLVPGWRTIIRALSIEDSMATAAAFREDGWNAVHIDGKTKEHQRIADFGAFKSGKITHLCNVDLFGEGIDISGVQCCIDQRPTDSLTLFLQFVGRMLRPEYAAGFDLNTRDGRLAAIAASNKPYAVYIDQVGNIERHGLPCDIREWSLDGKKKKRDIRKTFTCKKCYGVFDHPFSVCPSCGAASERVSQGRVGPEQVEGELVEVDKARRRPTYTKEYRMAGRSLEDLKAYAKARGYKESWATYRWNARQQKLSRA